jgi:hypothetical protein
MFFWLQELLVQLIKLPKEFLAMSDVAAVRKFSREELVLLCLITAFYLLMVGHYRTFDLDNVWFLSFTHAYWNEGQVTDMLMQQPFPAGMGGVIAFGKLAAWVQGPVLSVVGWSLAAASVLSALFVIASVWLLADMCRRLNYSAHMTLCFLVLVAVPEPFVFASQETRFEFLTIFLLSFALWLAARNSVVAAALVAAVAVEVEPIAIIVWMAVAAALLVQQRERASTGRTVLKIVLGSLPGVAVYAALHPHILEVIRSANWHNIERRSFPLGFVSGYYLRSKRHLVDLAVMVAAVVVAVRFRRAVLLQWPAAGALAIMVGSAVLRWQNDHYFGLAMPFFAMFATEALFSEHRWRWISAGVLAVMLPQYVYRYAISVRQSPAFTQADERQVSEALQRVSSSMKIPTGTPQILGNVHVWFARPGRYLALDRHQLMPGAVEHPDVVLCFETKLDAVLVPALNPELTCSELNGLLPPAETLTVHGRRLHVIQQAGSGVSAPAPAWLMHSSKGVMESN